jgi:hypothetical protein
VCTINSYQDVAWGRRTAEISFTTTEQEAQELFDKFMADFNHFSNFCKYVAELFVKRREWCFSYRRDVINIAQILIDSSQYFPKPIECQITWTMSLTNIFCYMILILKINVNFLLSKTDYFYNFPCIPYAVKLK